MKCRELKSRKCICVLGDVLQSKDEGHDMSVMLQDMKLCNYCNTSKKIMTPQQSTC